LLLPLLRTAHSAGRRKRLQVNQACIATVPIITGLQWFTGLSLNSAYRKVGLTLGFSLF
jgi:hypothetical protein